MFLLLTSIIVALLVTLYLPLAAGLWLNKRLSVTWRVILYGVMGYLIVQNLKTLLVRGFSLLVEGGTIVLSEESLFIWQVFISILLAALLGVLVRWAGMRFIKENLNTLESSYGLGVGYGGAESVMLVGLPLLSTFITMLLNMNIDPQTTALEPEIAAQIQALWQVPFYVPLAGSIERIAALVMHITVTVLVLQSFVRRNSAWLVAAFGLEVLVNGLIAGLAQIGLGYGWVILLSIVLMGGNLFVLYRLRAFEFDITKGSETSLENEEPEDGLK